MAERGTRRLLSPAFALTILLSCATGSESIDPEAVKARISASEAEFRELANRTIEDADRARTFIDLLDERHVLIADTPTPSGNTPRT